MTADDNEPASMTYTRHRIDPRLAEILERLHDAPLGTSLTDRLVQLVEVAPPTPTGHDLQRAISAHQWLLDRAAAGGLPLTAAGYLKPADVKALAEVLPTMLDWPFGVSREINTQPVLAFREFMQRVGLLRKYKGTLVLTTAGKAAQRDTDSLWRHLADRLIPTRPAFDGAATVLLLVHTATSPDERIDMHAVTRTLVQLGWSHSTGQPVTNADVQWIANDVWHAIGDVGPFVGSRLLDRKPSPPAIALIRDALLTEVTLDNLD